MNDNNKKLRNDSNFWELITDVAKDLDLALQDLSPDFEISNNINNGIICENASNDSIGSEDISDPILLEQIALGIAGNNSHKDSKHISSQKPIDSNSINDLSIKTLCLEPSVPPSEPTLTTQSSSAISPSNIPLISSSTTISSQIKTPSYSSQLLSVMDNKCVDNERLILSTNQESVDLSCCEPKSQLNRNSNDNCFENDKTGDHSGASCESIPACIGLLERLIRCHPIWFLPEIGRAGVVHLLQGKESGCFIVRQSSKANTMALSVRLPEGRGPHVEHYLIEDGGNGKLHLEGSDNYFNAIPMLVCHYSNCCDELPVQLTLHKLLVQSTRQQLTSLALLGQDFWQSSLAKLVNDNDINGDNNSVSSNSLTRPLPNLCSTFKSDSQPPPVPPKLDVSTLDPLIDTKKSSTVPITVTSTQTPKLPPRRPDPPPVPPRSKFISNNNNLNTSSTSKQTTKSSETNVTKSASINDSSIETAPNTEITLINVNKNRRLSTTSSHSSSSHVTDDVPQEGYRNSFCEQKKVMCYRSSLHDKESDYEDIWGANASKLNLCLNLEGITENYGSNIKCQRSTQTDRTCIKSKGDRQYPCPYSIDPVPNHSVIISKTPEMRRSDTDLNEKNIYETALLSHSMESLIDNIKYQTSQVDTCQKLFNTTDPNVQDVCVQVGQSVTSKVHNRSGRESSWPIDQEWQWLDDGIGSVCARSSTLPFRRHIITGFRRNSFVESMRSDVTTVEDLIVLQAPELTVPKVSHLSNESAINGNSSDDERNEFQYHNLENRQNNNSINHKHESINDTDTEFSEPWDSNWWEGLIKKVFPKHALMQLSPDNEDSNLLIHKELLKHNFENSSTITSLSDSHMTSTVDITEVSSIAELRSTSSISENNESNASDRLTVLESNETGIGQNICNYIFKLTAEGNNTFAKAIDHFIQCTQESTETNPIIVMRNIRQFMNGMKNYLVKHGEGELTQMVEHERSKLKQNEFLNIDAILEGSLHKLVIKPLKKFLYQLFINEYERNGSLKLLSNNIKEAQTKSAEQIGVRPELLPLDSKAMVEIQKHLFKLQQSYSPLKKLEYLLTCISTIYNSVRKQQKINLKNDSNTHLKPDYASFGADDFLPIFIYVLIQCGVISAEIEADYMLGLLHPSILSGEGGYYLTALSSAVHVLKNMKELQSDINTIRTNNDSITSPVNTEPKLNGSSSELSETSSSSRHSPHTHARLPSIADLQGYMKVMIPDELTSNIVCKTLPVRPNMTTKEVCKMIAHKFKITNPEDFGLFKLIYGEENQLNDNDLPQVIKTEIMISGKECQFTYKRCDAKFIWPLSEPKVISSSN